MKTLKEYFVALVITLFGALFMRTFLVQAFRIPTGSMKDTLLIGDFLLVNKAVFAVRKPVFLPNALLSISRFTALRKPRRGEVIVFKYPNDPSVDYIKRCIGLPGDTIEIRDGRLYINNRPEGEETFIDKRYDEEEQALYGYFRIKTFDSRVYTIRRRLGHTTNNGDFDKTIVPAGHYFVLGDNRDNSSDSRVWGFLPEEMVIGKALLIYFSYDYRRTESPIFARVRWGRILKPVR